MHEVLKPIPLELRCDLSWKDLAFFCPLTPERRSLITTGMSETEIRKIIAAGDEEDRGYPLPTIAKPDGGKLKAQILFPSSG